MSTFRAKRVRRSPSHSPNLDPFAVLFGLRTVRILSPAERCLRQLFASGALLASLFGATTNCFAAHLRSSHPETERSARAAVKATYEAYLRAWKDKDYTALSNFLSDDYQAVNFQGIVSTKANEIATAQEDRTYNTLSGDVLSVALVGDCAIASGLIEAGWKGERENSQTSTFRFLAVLQKQKGDWKLVATQSTKFNRPAEPGRK